ncbi:MAG: hypothetical protein ABIP74_02740 [Candidatus Saccharimonas sp.]
MVGKFDQYPHLRDHSEAEAGFEMTTEADYIFKDYEHPPFAASLVLANATRLSRLADRLDKLSPTESDLVANQVIINASAAEVRSRPAVIHEVEREQVPATYELSSFARDANAAYAPDSLCTAWLELYYRQVETGDYPVINELKAPESKSKLHRLVPRQISERLPDGSVATRLEIYLDPDLYLEYREQGLISDTPGGKDGVPRMYWFERDGDGYKAGTNADRIYRTDQMQPLSMATLRGTNNSVELALRKIPGMINTQNQDKNEHQAALAEQEASRSSPFKFPDRPGYQF